MWHELGKVFGCSPAHACTYLIATASLYGGQPLKRREGNYSNKDVNSCVISALNHKNKFTEPCMKTMKYTHAKICT